MEKPIILIADANSRIRQFLKRELCAEGFIVDQAGNYDEMITRIGTLPRPDLVVLDPDLPFAGARPAMDRMMHQTPKIPLVIYSPYTEYAEHPIFRKADAFVEKIADPASLVETVRVLLKQK